jgi:phosphate transport system substrate-binding protein
MTTGCRPGVVEVNPAVVAAMREVGVDITAEFPKPWTEEIASSNRRSRSLAQRSPPVHRWFTDAPSGRSPAVPTVARGRSEIAQRDSKAQGGRYVMVARKRRLAWLGVFLAFSLTAAACGDDDDEGGSATEPGGEGGGEELSGRIEVDGSSTVGPLTEAAAELYQEEQPGVQITVGVSGTGGGFERFCIGETDMSDASRPITDDEIAMCEENGIEYDDIQVANDALSVVVNPDNPIECLTVEQVSQIWDEGSTVSSWSDIDGLDESPDGSITLYGPGTDSGTFDFFTEAVNGEEGQIRSDYVDIGEDDQAAIEGVAGDAGAMGYIPYSFVTQAGESVKPLQIDGGGGCVDPTLQNVQSGSYVPLGRPLFVYASGAALQKPEVLGFMTFYIDNAEPVADAASFVPLTAEQIEEQHAKIEELVGG